MNIYASFLILFLVGATVSCTAPETKETEQKQPIMSSGIFKTHINVGRMLHFDTLQQTYRFDADTSNTLKYVALPLQGDFLLSVQLQEKSSIGEYGFLLTTDEKGEQPIATLQMINNKVAFGPAGLVNESTARLLDAKFLKLERVGKRLTAYYGTNEDKFKPLAAQQLSTDAPIYGGLFVRKNQVPVMFANLIFTKLPISVPQ